MKKIYTFIFSFVILMGLQECLLAQTYTMPSSGTTTQALTTINAAFVDPGGSGGGTLPCNASAANYPNNCNSTETFSTTAPAIITVNFSSFGLADVGDVLTIYDGPTIASSQLLSVTGLTTTAPNSLTTSGNSITFQFTSDGSGNCRGWIINLTPGFVLSPASITLPVCSSSAPFGFWDPSYSGAAYGGAANCTVSGATAGANYQDNVDITETFCSSGCENLTYNFAAVVSSFGLCAGDTLWAYDGPSAASSLITGFPVTNSTTFSGSGSTSGNCITIRFKSDNPGVNLHTNNKGFIGSLACGTCPAAPANNNCAGSILLTPGASCNPTAGTTYASDNTTSSLIPPCPGTTANDDVWYRFVANNTNMTITETATGGTFRPVIQVFDGSAGCPANAVGTTSIGCATAGAAGGTATLNLSGLTVGNTYYVRVYDYTANTSSNVNYNYTICAVGVNAADCQGNSQLCTSAAPLNPITNITSSGIGTPEWSSSVFGCLVSGEHNSRWYAVQALSTGYLAWYVRSTTTADIDFSMWGPFTTQYGNCGASLGSPLRCDYSVPETGGYANITNQGWVGACAPFAASPYTVPGYATGLSAVERMNQSAGGWGAQSDFISSAGGTYNCVAFVSPVCVANADLNKWYIILVDVYAGQGTYTLNFGESTATFTCASIPAPIQLTSFTGVTVDNSVNVLDWITASEVNTESFTLQRSADGIDFETIATLPAAGFSTQQTTYEYTDRTPLKGKNVYRLIQKDIDNSVSFSSLVVLEITGTETALQNIHPNPAKGLVYYDVLTQQDEDATILLIDQFGRTLSVEDKAIKEGRNTFTFDMSPYDAGLYHLQVRLHKSGDVLNGKVIKVG